MSRRRHGGGKRSNFTPAQNRALRALLRTVAERYATERELWAALGVRQQSGYHLMRAGGFSYGTAAALMRLAGLRGLDSFFAEKGLLDAAPPLPAPIHARAS